MTSIESHTDDVDCLPILTFRDNITVRFYRLSDAPIISRHANNRKIWANLSGRFPHPYTEESALSWIVNCSGSANWFETHNGRRIPSAYAICINDQPVGSIGLEFDGKYPHSVEFGYWLSEDYWGQGIVSMVAASFLKWTFDTFPWILRVGADAYGWNEASAHILQKIGLEPEGRRRLAVCRDGKYTDLVLFGIVRQDFESEG